jgi:hypothetical protein
LGDGVVVSTKKSPLNALTPYFAQGNDFKPEKITMEDGKVYDTDYTRVPIDEFPKALERDGKIVVPVLATSDEVKIDEKIFGKTSIRISQGQLSSIAANNVIDNIEKINDGIEAAVREYERGTGVGNQSVKPDGPPQKRKSAGDKPPVKKVTTPSSQNTAKGGSSSSSKSSLFLRNTDRSTPLGLQNLGMGNTPNAGGGKPPGNGQKRTEQKNQNEEKSSGIVQWFKNIFN